MRKIKTKINLEEGCSIHPSLPTYKSKDALKTFSQMDNVASGGTLLEGMGFINKEEQRMIGN